MQSIIEQNNLKTQLTSNVMMIRPARFDYNQQTAANNAFQNESAQAMPTALTQSHAVVEFDNLVDKLIGLGVNVEVIEDTHEPHKPDAIFPNNWVSFHSSGKVILYPMFAPNRRCERRQEIIDRIAERYEIKEIIDLSYFEQEGQFLESTGSMIFDHLERVAYACLSERTHPKVLEAFAKNSDYQVHSFNAYDPQGQAIYHTNVMMNIGEKFAVICLESIHDVQAREALVSRLEQSGREIIPISFAQTNHFAGNMLELKNAQGSHILVMSEQAKRILKPEQIERLEQYAFILDSPLYTIEQNGGGSARCMIAEIFLMPRS